MQPLAQNKITMNMNAASESGAEDHECSVWCRRRTFHSDCQSCTVSELAVDRRSSKTECEIVCLLGCLLDLCACVRAWLLVFLLACLLAIVNAAIDRALVLDLHAC